MAHRNRVDSTHRACFDRAKALGAVVIEIPTTRRAQDAGNPDGFIWHKHCGWCAIQVKGPHTRFKQSQLDLAKLAPIDVVRTANDMEALITGCHPDRPNV